MDDELIFRDPLSNLLFHTKLTLPSPSQPQSPLSLSHSQSYSQQPSQQHTTYHLIGTGTSGFFTVGYYSQPVDTHESIHRYLNLTHLYGKPLELNERIFEVQRLLITSQKPIFFLLQLTQDIDYDEFRSFFEVQILAQHRALSSEPTPQQSQNAIFSIASSQGNNNLTSSQSSPTLDQSTSSLNNNTNNNLQSPASPTPRAKTKKPKVQISQQLHDDLQLLLSSFPRHQYRKGDRILFFQGESSLRLEIDCPHQRLIDPQQQQQQQYNDLSSSQSQHPIQPSPIPSDNIICQHLRSIFILNGIYPFDQHIEVLYCRTPNHLPQPSLQRLPVVLLQSLLSGVSIHQQQQDLARRQSFSTMQQSLNHQNNNTTFGTNSTNNNPNNLHFSGNYNTIPSKQYRNTNNNFNNTNHFSISLHDGSFRPEPSTTSDSSSSDSSSSDDDDIHDGFDDYDFHSYETQRQRHQLALQFAPSNQPQSGQPNSSNGGQIGPKNGPNGGPNGQQQQNKNANNQQQRDLVCDVINETVMNNENNAISAQNANDANKGLQKTDSFKQHVVLDLELGGDINKNSYTNKSVGTPRGNSTVTGQITTIQENFSMNASQSPELGSPHNTKANPTTPSPEATNSSLPGPNGEIQTDAIPPLVLPLIKPDQIFRSSYTYLEKSNIFGFSKWKRRYLSIKGQYLLCSHHHLMEPTISLNLQTCQMFVDSEHRTVEYDALPILNSPNSYLYNSLGLNNVSPSYNTNNTNDLDPSNAQLFTPTASITDTSQNSPNTQTTTLNTKLFPQMPNLNRSLSSDETNATPSSPNTNTDSSLTKFFSELIDKHLSNDKNDKTAAATNQQRLGSHLTRIPQHLCSRNSYHIIIVIVDQTSGYQLRVSVDPPMAKKWLRDLIVVATLSRVQFQFQNEVLDSAQNDKTGAKSTWHKHYYKLLPLLAHYRRDPSLLKQLPQYAQSAQGNSDEIASTPVAAIAESQSDDAKLPTNPTNPPQQQPKRQNIGEVLPDHVVTMLQRKQREFIYLSMKNGNSDVGSPLNPALDVNNYKQSYEETKSAMYGSIKPAQTPTNGEKRAATIEPIATPMKKQPPAASAKGYFDALSGKGQKNAKNQRQQRSQIAAQQHDVPQYLASGDVKLNKVEAAIGAVILLAAFMYYFMYRM